MFKFSFLHLCVCPVPLVFIFLSSVYHILMLGTEWNLWMPLTSEVTMIGDDDFNGCDGWVCANYCGCGGYVKSSCLNDRGHVRRRLCRRVQCCFLRSDGCSRGCER
jgi:hypothetical protein